MPTWHLYCKASHKETRDFINQAVQEKIIACVFALFTAKQIKL